MKSHAPNSLNGAAWGEGVSDSHGPEAPVQYLREAELKHGLFGMLGALGFPVTREASRLRAKRVSDGLEWDPLDLLPSDQTTGWQPAVFAVDTSLSNDKVEEEVQEVMSDDPLVQRIATG